MKRHGQGWSSKNINGACTLIGSKQLLFKKKKTAVTLRNVFHLHAYTVAECISAEYPSLL